MPISADQAREIAREFLEMSHALGSYRFRNWSRLTKSQRQGLENAEWEMLNYSSSFVTAAAGIVLADMAHTLDEIAAATAEAKKAVAAITEVKDVLKVAAALIQLGGAIASRNPAAIYRAAANAAKTAKIAFGRRTP
jgi:predicted tellurium resistance membrane protein TerC